MNDNTQQLNIKEELDNQAFKDSYKNLYNDLYKDYIAKRTIFGDKELAEFVYNNVLNFYHIEKPENLDKFDLSMVGIISKDVKIDFDIIKSSMTPFLCTNKETNEYVILVPKHFIGYSAIMADGKKAKVNKKFLSKLDINAKAFYKCFQSEKMSFKNLIQYIISIIYPSDLLIYFICIILVTLVGLFIPLLNQYLFSSINFQTEYKELAAIVLILFAVSNTRIILDSIKKILQKRIMLRQSAHVNTAMMYRILTLPATFFRKNLAGELSYKLQYINNVCSTMLGVLFDTTIMAIFSIVYIFQINYFDKTLLLPSLIIILASCAVNISSSFIKSKYMRKVMDITSKESGMSYNIISGVEKIKLTGSEKRAFSVWSDEYRKLVNIKYFPSFFIIHNASILKTIELSGTVIFYIVCIMTSVSKADYIAFITSFGILNMSFINLSNVSEIFAEIKTSLDFAKPIIEETPENKKDKIIVNNLKGDIVFSNVSFAYDDDKNLFDDLSFNIKSGEYVAIVGASGTGKSTIIRLLLGFENIKNGAIYVDNIDIKDYELSSYRKNIGSVLQNEKLYSMNIKSNIKMMNSEASDKDIEDALKKAEIYEELNCFPMGLNTFVTDNFGLSTGQKQRILLARCFVTKNNIMIFDEATNALDINTEKKVFNTIKNLKCTRIIIAHTFSSIKDCDKIIVLDNGRVAEIGKYDELIKNKNVFYNLINAKTNNE